MSTGFVLVLLREIRESIVKLRGDLEERHTGSAGQLEQTAAALGRVEQDVAELRKFMRQVALNQAKHEEQQAQRNAQLELGLRELRDELRRLRGEL